MEKCRKIVDLSSLLNELAQLHQMTSLSLLNNKLTSLPANLSVLKHLEKLYLKGNQFESMEQVVEVLESLHNLKELSINLKTNEEAQLILLACPSLEVLNGERVEDSDQEPIHILNELTDVTKIYDLIMSLKKDKDTRKLFNVQIEVVTKELEDKLTNALPVIIKDAMILKSKYVLINTAFSKMIDMYSGDKLVASIWNEIKKMYKMIFESFSALLMNAISSEPKTETVGIEYYKKNIANLKNKFDIVIKEKIGLAKMNDELLLQINSLEEENKKHLDNILRYSRDICLNSPSNVKEFSSPSQRAESYSPAKTNSPQNFTQQRALTLKQLKDLINDICNQKEKYNEHCTTIRQPKITMEQYMYIYLNQRYGLKSLIIEWANTIVSGIRKYASQDSDVCLFGKLLQNKCDEDYRFVHQEVKSTILNVFTTRIKRNNPGKNNEGVMKMLREVVNEQIEESSWKGIIRKMYNEEDYNKLLVRVEAYNKTTTKKSIDYKNKIPFSKFLKVVLDFQMLKHEKFLSKFITLFRKINKSTTGVISSEEFVIMIKEMKLNISDTNINKLLEKVDPFKGNKITFSECVELLTLETIEPNTDPIIEIFNAKP